VIGELWTGCRMAPVQLVQNSSGSRVECVESFAVDFRVTVCIMMNCDCCALCDWFF